MRAFLAGAVAVSLVLLAVVTIAIAEEDESHAKPRNVNATCYAAYASVSWTAVDDDHLIGYDVYRRISGDSSFTKLNGNPLTVTTYLDSPLQGGTTYDYGVKAVYNDGHTSFLSDTSSCTTA